ncbi:MAG: flagellar filament capping protein FliD [Alphaproteobacteria bacterium]|nr:flagellar filament capping protein FliD [Alphaproteobacteria bacterium]
MNVDASNGMGLYGKLTLGVNEKTGKVTGGSDVFVQAADEMYEAKLKTKEPLESDKKNIDLKLEALANLQAKAKDLQTCSSKLFHTDGLGNMGVFADMYAGFSSTSSTPVADLIDLNIVANANLQDFTLEITQLAKNDSTFSSLGVASSAVALNWTGTYTLNGVDITVDATKTLQAIKEDINRQSDITFVQASVIKVSNTDFRLALQSTKVATPITIVNSLTGFTAGQVPAASGKTIEDLSASFKFNDIPMTRTENNVTDIVDGMTVVLKKAEPGTKMTISLHPDQESTKDAIRSWVVALNSLIEDVAMHKKVDYEKKSLSSEALLHGTTILNTMDSLIRDSVAWLVNGNTYKDLASVGLNTDYFTNKISIDEQKLDAAVKNDFNAVRKLFEYQAKLSNSNMLIADHPPFIPSSIIANSNGNVLTSTVTINRDNNGILTANLTISGGTYAAHTFEVSTDKISVQADVIQFSGDNALSANVVDNPYKGFSFVYIGASTIANSASDSSTFTLSQGFADRIQHNLTNVLEEFDGGFTRQKNEFISHKEVLDKKITKISEAADSQKEKFQKQIAQMESARQQLNALKNAADVFMNMMKAK